MDTAKLLRRLSVRTRSAAPRPHVAWIALAVAALLVSAPGCESLPGDKGTQGAVLGGVAGAATGAAVDEDDRVLAGLVGGALGAGAGYLLGANVDRLTGADDDVEAAQEAVRDARRDPATVAEVEGASTADLDGDGFVTFDEVVAMERAGLSDAEMLDRLEATGQVFDLTDDQERRLMDAGVSETVVRRMETLQPDARREVLSRSR